MTRKDESPEFCEFWLGPLIADDKRDKRWGWLSIARHTDGRLLAREAFHKHVRNGADPRDIIDGARWFIRSMKDRDKEFVPMSATWLNRGAYEDFAGYERAFVAAQSEKQSNVVNINRPAPRSKWALEYEARKAASE